MNPQISEATTTTVAAPTPNDVAASLEEFLAADNSSMMGGWT